MAALAVATIFLSSMRASTWLRKAHAADDAAKSDDGILAVVCDDGFWDPGEFCGRDAFVVTGTPDMNHDCVVNWLDLGLFFLEQGSVGDGFSGDLDSNGFVDNADLATLAANYGETPTPCTPGPIGTDACGGTIALSFNADPSDIDPSLVLGAPSPVQVYLVADDVTNATIVQYTLRITGSATLLSGPPGGADQCTDAGSKQYFRTHYFGGATTGPVVIGSFFINVTALTPVTLELRPFTATCASGGRRLRWSDFSLNRSIDFVSFGNAAINGTVPAELSLPDIASITDIKNDQGRQVRVTFSGSLFDAASVACPVQQYEVFRRIDDIAKPEAADGRATSGSFLTIACGSQRKRA